MSHQPSRSGAPQVFRRRFLADLRELLSEFPHSVVRAGMKLSRGVRIEPATETFKHEIVALVGAGFGVEETATLFWDPQTAENEPLILSDCTCDDGSQSSLCRHVWALATAVMSELNNPNSRLSQTIFGCGDDKWRSILRPLDHFLRVSHLATAANPDDTIEIPTQRLVYKVETVYNGLTVSPFEQNVLKNGQWSKGKRVDWRRFLVEHLSFAEPIDREVRQAARLSCGLGGTQRFGFGNHYYQSYEPDSWDVLSALVGHPLVFVDTTPLKLSFGKVELSVETQADGSSTIHPLVPGMSMQGCKVIACRERGLLIFNREKSELVLCPATGPQLELAEELFRNPATFPREAIAEVLPRLTQLESAFKITYPKEMEGQTVPGNPQTVVRLVPRLSDGGMSVEIWVRPQPEGAYCEPGEGANFVASWAREERVAVERDLPAELAAANDCVKQLRLERFRQARPWRWVLDPGDATLDFQFDLHELQNAPWKVEWSNSAIPRPDVVGEITAAGVQLEIDCDRDWFGVEGTVEIGETRVPLMAVIDALRRNSKYVQLEGGKWARIAAEFRDRLSALADLLHRNHSKLNIDVSAAPLLEDIFHDQQVNIRAAAEWKGALKRLELARQHQPAVPAGLKADLRDYQVEGYKWLSRLAAWGVGGCLADDMGLGKTVQALAVILERQSIGPTLVVAPVSVGFNWVNETTRFAPELRPHLYRDTERGEFLCDVKAGDIVVASYGLLLRDAQYFTKVQWGTLVLDEAQFVKNSRTKSAQVVRDLQAGWRLTLTGTPVENQLSDLWSLFRATAPGLFGSWERFRERFADPIEKQKLPERQQALARTVRPFLLRRTKAEVLKELPSRTETVLTAELSKPERKLYEDARLLALTQLSGIDAGQNEARFQVLAMLTRLRQLACHPQLVDAAWKGTSAKLDLFMETVEELREGQHRALVFSQFTSHLDLIRKALDARNISYLYLDGQTSAKQRRERVEAFQAGTGDLFLISLKAGGTGLNLTAADYVIHMDPWWNPAVEDQATDRAHRIGQTKPVMVYRLVAQDTIEQKILALHEQKRNLVASVMDGSDHAGKLSTEELIDLIRSGHTPEMPQEKPTEMTSGSAKPKKSRAPKKTRK